MRTPRNWFNRVRRKFLRTSHKNIVIFHSNAPCSGPQTSGVASHVTEEILNFQDLIISSPSRKELTGEDDAAIKIQANFRGHLARRAYRALRSLVKLQALARGAYVRKQARVAQHCMHALVRLQVRVRARQLLSRCSDD
ncbi:hypothetical protein K2173_006240 [Erythroxylum novogranatense]|uniref:Uncharacterized protein n=1 Tax=Erythroxylum novogranatense TaxID=1862640 RepID=A0AAV8TCL7_9ROSI|nr:hypothetical protein K2173_006240 [Erythroxylum novogranatense]